MISQPPKPSPKDVKWVASQLQAGYRRRFRSRAAAARKAGVTDRAWQRLEKADSVPEARSVVLMAKAVGIDPRPLLLRLGYDPEVADQYQTPPDRDERLNQLEERLVRLERRLPGSDGDGPPSAG